LAFTAVIKWDIDLQVTRLDGAMDVSMTELTYVPAPSALILGGIGTTFYAWLLRRRKDL
jgi:hypothetical protein